jgi:spermidine/putrescine transport system substrate-binding protein
MSNGRDDLPGEEHSGTNRRTFIKRASLTAAGLSVPGLLEACGSTGAGAGGLGPGGLQLARPNMPVTLPIYSDNKPIVSGLKPEPGPLQFFNWLAYINPAVVADFEKKYDVKVQVTTFTTIAEASAKLTNGGVQYDVFVPELVLLERLVVGKTIQPLNLSYIPNLKANVWPSLQSPWYDVGAHYTVPYTIYTTGVAWRTDKVPGWNPAGLPNPWSALWDRGPSIKGKVGMLDDQHEGLAMALLHDRVTEVNTENARWIHAAKHAVIQLINEANLKFDTDEYQRLADGELWLHQAWSGDTAAIPAYVPQGTPARVFRYWWPSDGRGPINIDTLAIVRGAKNPVLAHLFLNHILGVDEAFKNFASNYFQQPLNAMTPEAVVKRGLVVPNLQNTLIHESQFKNGLAQAPLSQRGEDLWAAAWAAVKSASAA